MLRAVVGQQSLADAGRGIFELRDLAGRQRQVIGQVRTGVESHQRDHAHDQRYRHVALGVVNLLGDDGHIAPAVIGPHDGRNGQADADDHAWLIVAGPQRAELHRFGAGRDEGKQCQEDHRADLDDRGHVLHAIAPARAQDVNQAQQRDRGHGDRFLVLFGEPPALFPSGVPQDFLERHSRINGQRGDRGRANDPELGPHPQERPQPAIGFAQKDIRAAGMRKHARQLGHRQRAAQVDQAADDPQRQNQPDETARGLRDDLRFEEDARADDFADDDGHDGEQSQHLIQAVRIVFGTGGRGRRVGHERQHSRPRRTGPACRRGARVVGRARRIY